MLMVCFQNCSKSNVTWYNGGSSLIPSNLQIDEINITAEPVLSSFLFGDISQLKLTMEGQLLPPGSPQHRVDIDINHANQTASINFIHWNNSIAGNTESVDCSNHTSAVADYKKLGSILGKLQLQMGQAATGADGGAQVMQVTSAKQNQSFEFSSIFIDQSAKDVIINGDEFNQFMSDVRASSCPGL